jgi:hypothetical protein
MASWQSKHRTLPVNLAKEDQLIIDRIIENFNDKGYNHTEENVATAYHIYKAYMENPEILPKMQLASAAALPLIDYGACIAASAAAAVMAGKTGEEIGRIVLGEKGQAEYQELVEKIKVLNSIADGTFKLIDPPPADISSTFEKNKHDKKVPKYLRDEGTQVSSASMPPPDHDPDDWKGDDEDTEQERKHNCEKSESQIWKEFKNYKQGYRTNNKKGSAAEYYEWDYDHNDIEVYDHLYNHKGSLNPKTGELYKGPVQGRIARGLRK